MIDIFQNIILGLFLIKLTWNLCIPISAYFQYRAWKLYGSAEPKNISMALIVEIALLMIMTMLATFTSSHIFALSPLQTFLSGVGAIAISLTLTLFIAYVLKKFRK